MALSLLSRLRRNKPPTVMISGLDGGNMGPALGLWRSALDGDEAIRDIVEEQFEPEDVFIPCLELLLNLVHMVAEAERICPTDRCDGGANFLLRLGHSPDMEEFSLLCHQLAETLNRRPHTQKVAVTPVSAYGLLDLCVAVGDLIENHLDIDAREQIAMLEAYMLSVVEEDYA